MADEIQDPPAPPTGGGSQTPPSPPPAAPDNEEWINGIPATLKPRFEELRAQAKKAKELEALHKELGDVNSLKARAAEYDRFRKSFDDDPDYEAYMRAYKRNKGNASPAPAGGSAPGVKATPKSPDGVELTQEAYAKKLFDTDFANLDRAEQRIVQMELRNDTRDFETAQAEAEAREQRLEEVRQEIVEEIVDTLKGAEFKGVKTDKTQVYRFMQQTKITDPVQAARLLYWEDLKKGILTEAEKRALAKFSKAPDGLEPPGSGGAPSLGSDEEDFVKNTVEQIRARGKVSAERF